MPSVVTNARQIAAVFADRSKRWDNALRSALRKALVAVEQAAAEKLSGSGAAGSYPVPVRTGFLRRSLGIKLAPSSGMVFNTAAYAWAIHNGRSDRVQTKARPFLDDALKQADPGLIIQAEMRGAL